MTDPDGESGDTEHDGSNHTTKLPSTKEIETDHKYFSVDYCKRGTTKCKVCKKTIPKDELRIGKSVMFKAKFILQFYHVKCAFNAFERAKTDANVINSVDDLDGMNTISATDQCAINLMVTELKTKREQVPRKPTQSKTKPMTPVQEAPNSRLNRLKSSLTPSLGIRYTPTRTSLQHQKWLN